MSNLLAFLRDIDQPGFKSIDRALAVLWWIGRDDSTQGLSGGDICKVIEGLGHPKQNVSRLNEQLGSEKTRVHRVPGKNAWRLHPRGRSELDAIYEPIVGTPRQPTPTDSVVPKSLFAGTRTYIEKVVLQINVSYDVGLFDCCAVMCRRLLETLLIEVYEGCGRPDDIKAGDGNFHMFASLLRIFEADSAFQLSRNAKQGLQDFKKLGDLSAHNRRFNARMEDIDRVRDGIRVAAEELLHIAKLV